MAMRPLFGIVPVLMDEKVNHPFHALCPAPLLVLPPWPPLPSPPHKAPTAGSPLRGESPSGVPVLFLHWARRFGEQEMVIPSVSWVCREMSWRAEMCLGLCACPRPGRAWPGPSTETTSDSWTSTSRPTLVSLSLLLLLDSPRTVSKGSGVM